MHSLQQQVRDLADKQEDTNDKYSKVKQDNSALSEQWVSIIILVVIFSSRKKCNCDKRTMPYVYEISQKSCTMYSFRLSKGWFIFTYYNVSQLARFHYIWSLFTSPMFKILEGRGWGLDRNPECNTECTNQTALSQDPHVGGEPARAAGVVGRRAGFRAAPLERPHRAAREGKGNRVISWLSI